jgi:hypothetical protein
MSGIATPALSAAAQGGGSSITSLLGITTAGQKTMANSLPVTLASDQSTLPVSLAANQSVNVAQFGGSSVTIGQQLAGASLPVILPSATITTLTPPSNTGYALDSSLTTIDTDLKSNITLHAGTNNIGVIDIADTGGNKFTSNSTTFTAKFGLDTNLLGVLGTAFSTAGKVDVKGADGDVFIRQSTASNLLAQVSNNGTFAVQATEATLDAALIAQEATTSGIKGLTAFGAVTTNAPTYTTAKSDALSLDTSGLLRISLKDTPVNTNKFLVTADAITIAASQTLATVTNVAQLNGVGPTFNSTATSGKQAIDTNILSILGTAPTTAGFIDIKGADGNVFVRQSTASNLNATVVSGNATGSAVPANAFYTAFDAATALPTAGSAGNLTGAMADKFGRQVVLPITVRDLTGTQTTTISASTSETTIVTQAASVFNDLLLLVISNTSATATRIDFRDTTGGSVLFSVEAPATDTRGFSLGGVAIPQTTVNTNWTAQCATSVADIRIYAVFAKNK